MNFNKDSLSPLEALQTAMKKEKAACDFYQLLSEKVDDTATKHMFEFLAKEEIKHQEIIQKLLDERFYQEN